MNYQHKIEGCLQSTVGNSGAPKDFFEPYKPALQESLLKFQKLYEAGTLPHFTLPFVRKDLADIQSTILHFRDTFSDIIVLGTGGSSLGGQTLCAFKEFDSPKIHFLDNIDPHTIKKCLTKANPESTGVIAISKSGSTSETVLQFLTCVEHWRTHLSEQSLQDHFLVITEKKSSPLFRLAERFHMPFWEHDNQLGGRFSIFSLVGLLPAMLQGVNAIDFREGAASIVTKMVETKDVSNFEPAIGAALGHTLCEENKATLSVLMPYCDRLKPLSQWYRQLWAESLGKSGKGTTPVDALGAVDQHSQLQLYLDGPQDKFFTVITTEHEQNAINALSPEAIDDIDLEYLYGKNLGDLFEAEQRATIETLIKNKRPTRVMHVPDMSVKALGELTMHFIFETLFTADLLDVDPLTQPAVEQGKILAKQYLRESNA